MICIDCAELKETPIYSFTILNSLLSGPCSEAESFSHVQVTPKDKGETCPFYLVKTPQGPGSGVFITHQTTVDSLGLSQLEIKLEVCLVARRIQHMVFVQCTFAQVVCPPCCKQPHSL